MDVHSSSRPSRVLVTGVSTSRGGRVARLLEREPGIEAVIGVDTEPPSVELESTEFVRVGPEHSAIERIVHAAAVDTVVDTRMVVDRPEGSGGSVRAVHENNVIGTLNLVAACSVEGSPVRRFVFKSSGLAYGASRGAPAYFTESYERSDRPGTRVERDLLEAEGAVLDLARRNPLVEVTVLRFADVLGGPSPSQMGRLLSLPVIPSVLGFDPRLHFVDHEDAVHAMAHAVTAAPAGVWNVAADGVLTLSEIASIMGRRALPVIPPLVGGLVTSLLRPLGIAMPDEVVSQLTYGRALDNRAFKATGFHYRKTSREAVLGLRNHLRIDPVAGGVSTPYRYEPEVERFLRESPLVEGRTHGEDSADGPENSG